MFINFWHNFSPEPILFSYGFLTIRWYGVFIALALAAGVWVFYWLNKKIGIMKNDDVFDLAFWLAVGGIVGARAYEVFILAWPYYRENLWAIGKIWEGGLAIHGAIIGGLAVLAWWSWRHSLPLPRGDQEGFAFWRLADLIAVVLPLGQAIGRWGNYFNQELFGRPTSAPWGIFIAPPNRPPDFINFTYFHPAFLYESILDLALFVALWLLFSPFIRWRLRGGNNTGLLVALYFIGYGLIRFLMEFIRIDPAPLLFGLRLPQWVSLALIVAGFIVIFVKLIKNRIIEPNP